MKRGLEPITLFPRNDEQVDDIETYLNEQFIDNELEDGNLTPEEAGFITGWKNAFDGGD